jgi:hypothetical protein
VLLPLPQGKRAMSKASSSGERSQSRNKLLSALSDDDFTLLQPHLQRVILPLRQDLDRPNRRIAAVYSWTLASLHRRPPVGRDPR